MLCARNRARIASTARIARAERRPERRASLYASRAASVVASVAPAPSRAVSRSASETNGTPPASSTCAVLLALAGIALDCWMFVRNAEVGVAISSEPARAVPSEAEIRHRVLEAADLRALVVRHRRNRHGPELRGERADAEPHQEHRHEDDLRAGIRVECAEQHHRPAKSDRSPMRTTKRGEIFGNSFGCRSLPPGASPAAAAGLRSRARRGRARPKGRAGRRRRTRPGRGTGRRTSSARPSAACCGAWRYERAAGPCASRRACQRRRPRSRRARR